VRGIITSNGKDYDLRELFIEINNRDPDPTIALDANNSEMYYYIKSRALFYGKYLSGFAD
jgi:hypothetical protein